MPRSRVALSSFVFLALVTAAARAEQPSPYEANRAGKGELKFISGLPVLLVEGTPEEIGEQVAELTKKPLHRLLEFPRQYLKRFGFESAWPALVQASKAMVPQFPPDHLRELEAAAKKAGIDRDLAIVGNTFADIKKVGGCSTLIINPER